MKRDILNNDKSEYLKTAFNASKSEIEEIINEAFQPNRCWMILTINEQVVQVPTYLLAQLSDFILKGEPVKTSSTKINLKEELQTYYSGCEQMFIAAGNVFKEYLKADYKRILESGGSLEEKNQRLNALVEDARHYISCYGHFSEDLWRNTGGLIYGSPIDEVLSRIGEPISRSLQRLSPSSYYAANQWAIRLDKLSDIQKTALPKAKEYISLQTSDEKNKPYGMHQENEKWIAETWRKERDQLDSNNKADEEVQKLYSEKFNGMSISKRQIQRFTGR